MRGSIEQEIGALKADNVRNKNQLAELFRQSKEHSDQRAALNTDFAVLSEQLDEAVVSMNGLGGTLEG